MVLGFWAGFGLLVGFGLLGWFCAFWLVLGFGWLWAFGCFGVFGWSLGLVLGLWAGFGPWVSFGLLVGFVPFAGFGPKKLRLIGAVGQELGAAGWAWPGLD